MARNGTTPLELDSLPDGCLTSVLERLDLDSLIAMRSVSKRACQLASQPALWRKRFEQDYPSHAGRFMQRPALQEWPAAYQRRRRSQRRWLDGPAECTELRSHTGPVFSVLHLDDPFPRSSVTISGGVFGYGEVSELFQWNAALTGLPLDWPAAGQLGGVIALAQRPQHRQLVVGGFAGCAQVVELQQRSVETMLMSEVVDLCAGIMPDMLNTPHQELVDRLRGFGPFFTARHTHTLCGHAGAVPGACAQGDFIVTSGFDGSIFLWRPSDAQQQPESCGTRDKPAPHESPAATLVDSDLGNGDGSGMPESQSVCAVVLSPDCRTLASGCNDHQVRLWDVERRTVTSRLSGHTGWVWCLEEGPSPDTLISGATDGSVRLWDLRAGQQVAACSVGTRSSGDPTQGAVAGTALRPDKRALVCGSFDTLVSVVDLRCWRVSQSLKGHGHRVTRVAATDDGIFSASFDSTLRHWSFA